MGKLLYALSNLHLDRQEERNENLSLGSERLTVQTLAQNVGELRQEQEYWEEYRALYGGLQQRIRR